MAINEPFRLLSGLFRCRRHIEICLLSRICLDILGSWRCFAVPVSVYDSGILHYSSAKLSENCTTVVQFQIAQKEMRESKPQLVSIPAFAKSRFDSYFPIKSLATSAPMARPMAAGTKALLPGTLRR